MYRGGGGGGGGGRFGDGLQKAIKCCLNLARVEIDFPWFLKRDGKRVEGYCMVGCTGDMVGMGPGGCGWGLG